jgi:hypothetical protein
VDDLAGGEPGDGLRGGIPEADRPLAVDEEDAVADVRERTGGLAALLGLLVEARVVDGDGGAAAELLREGEVVLGVGARRRGDERERAERDPARHHRDAHVGAEAERAHELELALVGRSRREALLREDDELALAGPRHACGAPTVRGGAAAQLVGDGALRGVAVREGDPRELALVEDVDDAPVRELGNGELGDRRERLRIGERGRERVARAREERETALRVLRAAVEAGVRDGAAGELLRAGAELRVVAAVRLRPGEGQRADRLPVRDERDGDRGARRERLEELEVALVHHGCPQGVGVEGGEERRRAGAQRGRGGLRRAEARRVVAAELVEQLLLHRVRSGGGHALDAAARLQHVDEAPVGELRHGEAHEAGERLLELDRP